MTDLTPLLSLQIEAPSSHPSPPVPRPPHPPSPLSKGRHLTPAGRAFLRDLRLRQVTKVTRQRRREWVVDSKGTCRPCPVIVITITIIR